MLNTFVLSEVESEEIFIVKAAEFFFFFCTFYNMSQMIKVQIVTWLLELVGLMLDFCSSRDLKWYYLSVNTSTNICD